MAETLPEVDSLDELVELVARTPSLYVRWSRGPHVDAESHSHDELTGAPLPGLCANPLAVEEWWGGRSRRTWMARRLYDYRHLREKGRDIRPWVLEGREIGRGPDNEPLVECVRPVAWLSSALVEEADAEVQAESEQWGSLRRGRPGAGSERGFAPERRISARSAGDGRGRRVEEQPKRILIVEDDASLRDLLVLEMTGEPAFHLTSVGDGSQALELLQDAPFDLVVLDLQLPGASGLDILTTIQRDSPGTEVIVLTGLAPDDPRVVEALRRVEHLLEKPFPPQQVVALVRSCLTGRAPVGGGPAR